MQNDRFLIFNQVVITAFSILTVFSPTNADCQIPQGEIRLNLFGFKNEKIIFVVDTSNFFRHHFEIVKLESQPANELKYTLFITRGKNTSIVPVTDWKGESYHFEYGWRADLKICVIMDKGNRIDTMELHLLNLESSPRGLDIFFKPGVFSMDIEEMLQKKDRFRKIKYGTVDITPRSWKKYKTKCKKDVVPACMEE
jgi:hypothetical protein